MGNSSFLVLGCLVMLGVFMLSGNSLVLQNGVTAQQSEAFLTALSVGQSLIDEAKMKAFDERCTTGSPASPDSLTGVAQLGTDGLSEATTAADTTTVQGFRSVSHYDDVDDYAGYQRKVRTARLDTLTVRATVGYASAACPDSALAVRSFCKTMTVTVTAKELAAPVRLRYAFTY